MAVYRVLYQSILNAKLTGRKKLGRKMCTSNRDDHKLENTVKQSRFRHLVELHKEWNEAGVSASRVTTLRRLQSDKSKVNAAVYQEILEHFMLPSADKLYEDADSFSSRTLAPAHRAKTTSKWFADHDITVLDWPANMPDLNPKWNLWDIFKRKMRNSSSNNPDELKTQ